VKNPENKETHGISLKTRNNNIDNSKLIISSGEVQLSSPVKNKHKTSSDVNLDDEANYTDPNDDDDESPNKGSQDKDDQP